MCENPDIEFCVQVETFPEKRNGDKKEKGPIAKRPFPPGFHGRTKSRRLSDFGVRLKEKQKIRFHYGLKEKQVRTLVKKFLNHQTLQ